MHSNYINNKEKTYRLGVLEGNYVEEIYAQDYQKFKQKEQRCLISETKANFDLSKKPFNHQNVDNTLNNNGLNNKIKTTVDDIGKKKVLEGSKYLLEDENQNNIYHDESSIQDGEFSSNMNYSNPKINFNQTNKRLEVKEKTDDQVLLKNKKQRDGLSTHLFLSHGLHTEDPIREEYLSSYKICYDKHVKPQDIVQNNVKASKLLSSLKLNESRHDKNDTMSNAIHLNDIKKYAKKNQNFTKSYDKPHVNIGLRN